MNTAKFSILASVFAVLAFALPGALASGADICRENGQSYDAATWTWTGASWDKVSERPGYQTEVTGDATAATWESNRVIRAVYAVTDGTAVLVDERANAGVVESDGVDSLVLCLRKSGSKSSSAVNDQTGISSEDESQVVNDEVPRDEEEIPEVPEFGSILAIGTLGLVGAALVARKRA